MINPEDSDDKILDDVNTAIKTALSEYDAVVNAMVENEKAGITDPVPIIEKGVRCADCHTETLRYYEERDILKCDICKKEITGYSFMGKRVLNFGKDFKAEDLI